ncbi:hypothetical protein IQ265_08180 [Nodosilinea sp. LEGE 06152]|uniref:hypothetical protein n=1 Tax=Nodosilinea sp. LEGE 06152 TaxID=2777966 RepID=UPI00187F9613|nr:hypothetical protein [Nodosilinea sp. LEGE 06152]MBE9156806.1 hypothetical protein [Nodosilinea sp. LEGE 06152]
MEIIRRIISDIRKGENIDLYLFALAALALAILNGLGLASKTLIESVTLALLGLLAAYSLGIRDRLNGINDKFTGTSNLLYEELPSNLRDATISNSKELFIIGISLNRTIATFYSQLEQKLKDGQKIKILVVDPNGEAVKLIPQRIYRPISNQRLSDKISDTLLLTCSLHSKASDQIEIRTIDFPISFGCFASNIEMSDGSIYIEYYSYKTTRDLPCVVVSSRKNPYWYSVYKIEVLNLWNAGKEWHCKS